jgi:hypothetical protein
VRALVLAVALAPSVAVAGPQHAPTWEVSSEWGVGSVEDGTSTKIGGFRAHYYKPFGRHLAVYGETGLYPFWTSNYRVRAGGMLGGTFGVSYAELESYSSHTYDTGTERVTETRTTATIDHGRQVAWLTGVGADLEAYSSSDGAGLIAEGGFALAGQMSFELYAAYDLIYARPGGRMTFTYRNTIGSNDGSVGFSFDARGMFDAEDHPSPYQITFGLVFGPGLR